MGCCCTTARGLVSKQKRRTQNGDFDLDLALIHPNVVAMGFPSSGAESFYRNPYTDAVAYLDGAYGDRYYVYNLCSEPERAYPSEDYFHGRFNHDFKWPDHHACPLEFIPEFIRHSLEHIHGTADPKEWQSKLVKEFEATSQRAMANKEADENENEPMETVSKKEEYSASRRADPKLVVVHCKAGKGRTGIFICCLLLALDPRIQTAQAAMDHYGASRTHDGKGLTLPSQRRYVEYYARLVEMSSGMMPSIRPAITLLSLSVTGLMKYLKNAQTITIRIGKFWLNDTAEGISVEVPIEAAACRASGLAQVHQLKRDESEATDEERNNQPIDPDGDVRYVFDLSKLPELVDIQNDVRIDFAVGDKWIASLSFHPLFVKPFYSFREIDKMYKKALGEEAGIGLEYTKSTLPGL